MSLEFRGLLLFVGEVANYWIGDGGCGYWTDIADRSFSHDGVIFAVYEIISTKGLANNNYNFGGDKIELEQSLLTFQKESR